MKVITVNIQKGGTAKSTTVQATAEILSKVHKKKVLVIDMDAQRNLSTASGVAPDAEPNIFTVLKGDDEIESAIYESKYYDVIPAGIGLAAAEATFTSIGKENLLKERLGALEGKYDFVLIDTAPSLSLLNVMSMTAATDILVPLEASAFSIQGMTQLYESISLTKTYFNKDLNILGLLLTKYKKNTNLNKTVLENIPLIAKNMETIVFKTQIRESVRIGENQLMQKPLIDDKSNAMDDYKAFVKELLKEVKNGK